jgi:hypothetical protein
MVTQNLACNPTMAETSGANVEQQNQSQSSIFIIPKTNHTSDTLSLDT